MAVSKWRAMEAHDEAQEALRSRARSRIHSERGLADLNAKIGDPRFFDPDHPRYGRGGGRNAKQFRSPQGQVIGRLVHDAGELLEGLGDPSSERYAALREELGGDAKRAIDAGALNAERVIAAESRAGSAEMRDRANVRGSGRNPMAERNSIARHIERTGTQRAMVQTEAGEKKAIIDSQVSQFMQTHVRKWATDAVTAARDWTVNSPMYREEFQLALDSLAKAESEAGIAAAGQLLSYQERKDILDAQPDGPGWVSLTLGVVGALVGAYFGGGQGASMGLQAGMSVGGAIES